MSADFWMGLAAVPAGAASMTLTWWLIGKAIGLLRFPIIGFFTMHNPQPMIRELERAEGAGGFRFSVPGLVFLVMADKDREDR